MFFSLLEQKLESLEDFGQLMVERVQRIRIHCQVVSINEGRAIVKKVRT